MFQQKLDNENAVHRIVDEKNNLTIGVYPVLMGMRVRGGHADDRICSHLDWCCGDSQQTLEWAYGAMRHILEKRAGSKQPFKGIPTRSEIKPITLDKKFIGKIGELVETCFDMPTLPSIAELRSRYFVMHPVSAETVTAMTGEKFLPLDGLDSHDD